MGRKVVKIIIKSCCGYLCHHRWEDKLVVMPSDISYTLTMSRGRFPPENVPMKKVSWKKYFDDEEKTIVDNLFVFAGGLDYSREETPMVLDGAGIDLIVVFDDKTRKELGAFYGDCIDEHYGKLYTLLQMISPLVDNGSYKPEYFNPSEPEYYEDEE